MRRKEDIEEGELSRRKDGDSRESIQHQPISPSPHHRITVHIWGMEGFSKFCDELARSQPVGLLTYLPANLLADHSMIITRRKVNDSEPGD